MRNTPRLVLTTLVVLGVIGGGVAAALRGSGSEPTEAFIADADGRSLVQHGFSTAGSAKSSPDGLPDFTAADLDREQADIGTNFVRFLISWRAIEPEPGTIDETYLDGLEERLDWYQERGYHVMLDMHQDLWGWGITPTKDNGNGAPEWATYMDGLPVRSPQDMWELYYLEPGVIRAFDNFWNTTGAHPELTEHYAAAWRAVAERFADHPAVVAYDLMNEPYGGTLQGPAFESGPLTKLYQDVSDAIREVDQDSWLCLEPQAFGFNWGTPSGLQPIRDARDGDPRVAFCPHLYPLPMDLGEGFSGTSQTLVEGTITAWTGNVMRTAEALGAGRGAVPIVLGEFGLDTTSEGAGEYIDLVYRTADAHGMGVAYWSRDDGSWGPYETDGTARNLTEWLDRPYPRAVAGLRGWASDDASLTLRIDGADAAGIVSEVYLPPGVFGQVAVEGGEIVDADQDTGIVTFVADPTDGEGVVRFSAD